MNGAGPDRVRVSVCPAERHAHGFRVRCVEVADQSPSPVGNETLLPMYPVQVGASDNFCFRHAPFA